MAPHPLLLALAAVFIAGPPALAFLADRQVRAFQGEAFGHFRKAARNLRFALWAVLVYYAGVLLGSLLVGDLAEMVRWPLSGEGVVIYVRIGAAAVAYGLLWNVTRELYRITVPEPPGAPRGG